MADLANPPSINPLTDDHLQQINDALAAAAIAYKQLDLATLAGLDVTAQRASLDASTATLRQIKQVYFPGR
jgi:hypothetical protein